MAGHGLGLASRHRRSVKGPRQLVQVRHPRARATLIAVTDPHPVWIDQCEAARAIRLERGVRKALGYLVGEKLLAHVRVAETDALFAQTLPAFVEEVREIFEPHELHGYLDTVQRVDAHGHVLDDEAFEAARGMFQEDVVDAAEDVVRMGRIRELLLDEG
jgi:hypothetical protein